METAEILVSHTCTVGLKTLERPKPNFPLPPPPFPIPLSQYPSINVGKLGVFEKNIGYEDDWNVS